MKKALLALSLCASTVLVAGDKDYHWEFTPTIGGVLPEGNTGLKHSHFYGGRIAKNLQDSWFDQVEFGFDYSKLKSKHSTETVNNRPPIPASTVSVDTSRVKLRSYQLNLVKDLVDFSDTTKLYGLIGAGYMQFRGYDDEGERIRLNTGFGQYGLGLKHYWSDNFSTKLEVRDAITFKEHHKHFMFYSLGFGVDFGKRVPDAPVAKIGDSDGDGVPDNIDRCPNTPANVVVDEFGCEKVVRINLGVNFKFDSAEISPEYAAQIKDIANFLTENTSYTAILEGHTDSIGKAAYNKKLSERRAAAVAKVLIQNGVDATRITSKGFGEEQPIATNKTKEGRAQNRRVEAKFRK